VNLVVLCYPKRQVKEEFYVEAIEKRSDNRVVGYYVFSLHEHCIIGQYKIISRKLTCFVALS
jgi:hypothetical protein